MLYEKINNKTAKVSIIGIGYVGLPLACELAKVGFKVTGIDVSKERVKSVLKGVSYVVDIESNELKQLVKSGNLTATTSYNPIKYSDVVIVCVPTPLRKTKEPDISYVLLAVDKITELIHKNMLIIIESTIYPGATKDVILPKLQSSGLKVGHDFYLSFSPERVDPGNKKYTLKNTPKIVSGITKNCCELAHIFYSKFIDEVIPVSSTSAAEMAKLLENTFRMVNIALVNEIAMICDKLNLNVWEVIEAAKTKPFGFMPFYPGPGLGGHCLPVDPHYLAWKLRELNYTARFVQLAEEINSNMPNFVINKLISILNSKNRPLRGSKILILGVAYKANVSDIRESPALELIHILKKHGTNVEYNDPFVSEINLMNLKMKSTDLKNLEKYDCVMIVTAHQIYDFNSIVKKAKMIFDLRGVTYGMNAKNIYRL